MNINKAIEIYGTVAVLRYRAVAGLGLDSKIPEKIPEAFLGGVIACGIHDALNLHAHVERYYTVIANDLGVPPSANLTNLCGDRRADVAVYREGRPIAVVELKKFDDAKTSAKIAKDCRKMAEFSLFCGGNIECYLGVLVTQVLSSCATSVERARALGITLGRDFDVIGEMQRSRDDKWDWLFASGKYWPQS